MADILILNGPNLDMLGQREPEIYGSTTLADLEALCRDAAGRLGVTADFRQTNEEGEMIRWIHGVRGTAKGVILNAAAWTHTSVAIHDALKIIAPVPIVEVHISNPHTREAFRHVSYVSPVAKAVIAGCGVQGYVFALEYLSGIIRPS